MKADPSAARSALCRQDAAFDERFSGVSFAKTTGGENIAAYLQIVIQSSTFLHALLLLDGQFGVEREVVHQATIGAVPVVAWNALSDSERERSRQLSRELHRKGMSAELQNRIDRFAFDVYKLRDVQEETIADTLAVSLPTAASKLEALRRTTALERKQFAEVCEGELLAVLEASAMEASVRVRNDLQVGNWRLVQIDCAEKGSPELGKADLDIRRFIAAADEASASLVVVKVNQQTQLVGLLDKYRYWTRTRARLLAATVLTDPEDDD
jgi:hypothetical protein